MCNVRQVLAIHTERKDTLSCVLVRKYERRACREYIEMSALVQHGNTMLFSLHSTKKRETQKEQKSRVTQKINKIKIKKIAL